MIASQDGRPLLFLDVDGPLIPFRARSAGRVLTSGDAASLAELPGNPLMDRPVRADGRNLLGLGCELVWATTWMADANELVAPRLGLPQLPVVDSRTTTRFPRGACTGRRSLSPTGPAGARSCGSTTRSATPTVVGSSPITGALLYCTVSTRSLALPTPTSPSFVNGSPVDSAP